MMDDKNFHSVTVFFYRNEHPMAGPSYNFGCGNGYFKCDDDGEWVLINKKTSINQIEQAIDSVYENELTGPRRRAIVDPLRELQLALKGLKNDDNV